MDRSSLDQKGTRLFVPAFDITQTAEAGGEFTMPDYYPEIRRVVSVAAEALPDSKYLSDGNLEVGGTLAFNLLYIGDDGALSSVPYVTEYTQTIPIGRDFSGGSADIRAESAAESIVCRPLAPRTVSLKAKVKSRIRASRGEECALSMKNEDSSPAGAGVRRSLERLEEKIPSTLCKSFMTTGTVSGEHSLSSAAKPVICRGEVLIDSAVAGNDSVTVKGQIAVSCLILSAEGIYKTVTATLPMEERISAEGIDGGFKCAAFGRVASATVEGGEDGRLSIDAEYDIDAICQKPFEVFATEDIYSTEYALTPEKKEMNVQSLICIENGYFSVSGEGRRKSERGEADRIIHATADTKIDRFDSKESTATFTGSCTFKVLIASGGDVITEEFAVPVKYECPALRAAMMNEAAWHVHTAISRVDCALDESRITGKCDICIFAEAEKQTKCSPVTEATVGVRDRSEADSSTIRICYPEKGQRIWDIAKGCRAKMGETERTNRISRCDLSDGTPLIVK